MHQHTPSLPRHHRLPTALTAALLAAAGCTDPGGSGTETMSQTSTQATSSGTAQDASTTQETPPATTPGDVTLEAPTQGTTQDTTQGEEPTSSTTIDPSDTSTGGTSVGPDPNDPALNCATEPCFNVINKCGFPIWISARNNEGIVLTPDKVMLNPGGEEGNWQQYAVPPEWPAGRVNAHYNDPEQAPDDFDKVEMTVTGGVMNYNITYVDYVSLPSEMYAVGPECQPSDSFDPKVGCYVERAAILDGCPDDLLTGDKCLSASLYCDRAENKDKPYCHALDAEIAKCIEQHPDTCGVAGILGSGTPEVYACSGYFDSQPPNCMPASETCHFEGNKWCAALNRGMLDDPENTDTSLYYQKAPYNTYSKWVHDTCPGLYAFAYDDYPPSADESGFRSCKAPRLDIVFCPVG